MVHQGKTFTKTKTLLGRLQGLCFCVVALNLLWAFFADSPLSGLFSYASLGITVFVTLSSLLGENSRLAGNRLILYISLFVWFFIMIYAYGFVYNIHNNVSFLFITLDSYAMFFVRCIISIFPCMVFVHNNEFRVDLWIKILIFLVLAVSVYYVSYAIVVNPNALRERVTIEVMGDGEILKSTPGYSMIYSYSLLFPVFLDKWFCNKGKKQAYYFMCCIMMLYMIFVAQFATALLMCIVGVFVYMCFKVKRSRRAIIVIIGILVALVLIMTNGGTDLLRWLAGRVPGVLSEKLYDIAETLVQDNAVGSVGARSELYQDSIAAFKQNPLFGMIIADSSKIGGHATLIDILGISGLFGAIPFAASIYYSFKIIKGHSSYDKTKAATVAVFVEFLMMVLLKNVITALAVFFTFFAFVPFLLKAKE